MRLSAPLNYRGQILKLAPDVEDTTFKMRGPIRDYVSDTRQRIYAEQGDARILSELPFDAWGILIQLAADGPTDETQLETWSKSGLKAAMESGLAITTDGMVNANSLGKRLGDFLIKIADEDEEPED